jgi:hypothetical protein
MAINCDICIGLSFDYINEVIIGWETKSSCLNEALYVYHYKMIKDAKTYLCTEHATNDWKLFAGSLEKL